MYWDAPEQLAHLVIGFGDGCSKPDDENNVKIIVEDTALLDESQKI